MKKVKTLSNKFKRDSQKKQLGQFFTKNSDYILDGFESLIRDKNISDPFAGSGDLLLWAKKNSARSVKGFDVDKKYIDNKKIFYQDSINGKFVYDFVVTNPPYLNVNKASKKVKEKYFQDSQFEDLYQISLSALLNSQEGIVIVPINFLSANNSKKIREIFFSKFKIVKMNYFKQQVFPDTTYNVIAFYYRLKNKNEDSFVIKTHIYPENKIINIELNQQFGWSIGGDFLKIIEKERNVLGIKRLTEKDLERSVGEIEIKVAYNHVKDVRTIKVSKNVYNLIKSNVILLKAIDSGTEKGKISLENIKKYNVECLISKETSRHMIYLVFGNVISVNDQEKIIKLFNQEINKLRDDYLSLFLTNYRDNDRKRISFDFVYKFINYLYLNNISSFGKQGQLV
jgi:hypothetical protein